MSIHPLADGGVLLRFHRYDGTEILDLEIDADGDATALALMTYGTGERRPVQPGKLAEWFEVELPGE